ncbi:hypothetical protein BJF83_20760 [Nocardiopsis sp. CNR-923]|uniref:DUF6245 family protein n=1 Tax=Nocardiopsis sp. CNR-923 TaxID=1904965 RepID=UPI00096131FF|nr:DUF6245 family protein [Nocardiopsis sp. CNR-923]OLT26597.1 hypothetical protein BJF83_20760 [Nocardiopsis sp. CNR-923]
MAHPQETQPATVEQVAAAMAALGLYSGDNTTDEHAAEAARLGGQEAYRVRMVNSLLGSAQAQALLAETADITPDARNAAYADQVASAGADHDPVALVEFLRWQVLRAATPLREMAQDPATGPVPLAAAHAAEAIQVLLGVVSASRTAMATGDTDTLLAQTNSIDTAKEALENALTNVEMFRSLLAPIRA